MTPPPSIDDRGGNPAPSPTPAAPPPAEAASRKWSEKSADGLARYITGSRDDPDFEPLKAKIHEKLREKEGEWVDNFKEKMTRKG